MSNTNHEKMISLVIMSCRAVLNVFSPDSPQLNFINTFSAWTRKHIISLIELANRFYLNKSHNISRTKRVLGGVLVDIWRPPTKRGRLTVPPPPPAGFISSDIPVSHYLNLKNTKKNTNIFTTGLAFRYDDTIP